jgi:hypothetical protein
MSKYQNIPGPRMGEPEIPQQGLHQATMSTIVVSVLSL